MKYPVIVIKGRVITICGTEERLTRCSKVALQAGYFDGLTIIDASGLRYKVRDATKVGTVGPFFGYNIFLNQTLRVRLNFDGVPERIALDEVRRLVEQAFDADPQFWESGGDLAELRQRVAHAASVSEIASILGEV